ncbi:hypothetical protein ACA910_001605 [Epithemia clementina (nom. ined.)]
MCPFQCNACSFYNLRGRYPGTATPDKDKLLQLCIWRAILDLFWAREQSTVARNRSEIQGLIQSSKLLGSHNLLPPRGPYPVEYSFGIATACAMLLKTLESGRNTDQIQFETARKVRAAVSNFIHTTPHEVGASTIGYRECGSQFFSGSPTNSQWFKRFMSGCHGRMGDVWVPDKVLSLEEILATLDMLEEELKMLEAGQRRLKVAPTGSLLVCGYTAPLRGEELPLIDIGLIRKHWDEG